MAGFAHVNFYATVFRGDRFSEALAEMAPVALRYGATSYGVRRSRDDAYKFLFWAWFEDKTDWERFWHGPEMVRFRTKYQSWFQVPLLYDWWDDVASGTRNGAAAGNGAAAPAPPVAAAE